MAEDHDDLGTGHLGGELEAADHVDVLDVAGDPTDKDIADPLVEDDLGRDARIHTTENGGFWILAAGGGGLGLRHVITWCQLACDETLVARFEIGQHLRGCQCLLVVGGEHIAHELRGRWGLGRRRRRLRGAGRDDEGGGDGECDQWSEFHVGSLSVDPALP